MNKLYLSVVPLYYTYYSRLKSKENKIAYIFSYVIPIIIIIFQSKMNNSFEESIVLGIFSILSYMSIYEIGYLFNDIKTVKFEKNPTMRIEKEERNFLEAKLIKISVIKCIISFFIFELITVSDRKIDYFIVLSLTLCLYYFHNNIRVKYINFITFMLLSLCRFTFPIYIINKNQLNLENIIEIFFILVLIRNIELVGKKYNFLKLNFYYKKEELRVIYYLFLILLVKALEINKINHRLLYYMFCYRVICLLLKRCLLHIQVIVKK